MPRKTGRPEKVGDRAFLEALLARYGRLMYWAVREYTNDPEDQSDIMQDTMEKLVGKVAELRTKKEKDLPGYLTAMARWSALNFLKTKGGRQEREVELPEELEEIWPEEAPSAEEVVLLSETAGLARAILAELPEEPRELLRGKYILELSNEELARDLGCRPQSVRMKLTRARRLALEVARKMEGGERCEQAGSTAGEL